MVRQLLLVKLVKCTSLIFISKNQPGEHCEHSVASTVRKLEEVAFLNECHIPVFPCIPGLSGCSCAVSWPGWCVLQREPWTSEHWAGCHCHGDLLQQLLWIKHKQCVNLCSTLFNVLVITSFYVIQSSSLLPSVHQYWMWYLSTLIPRCTPFFILWFALTLIHRSGRAA